MKSGLCRQTAQPNDYQTVVGDCTPSHKSAYNSLVQPLLPPENDNQRAAAETPNGAAPDPGAYTPRYQNLQASVRKLIKLTAPQRPPEDSLYTDLQGKTEKRFKLGNDSASMGFAVFLKPEFLKTDKMEKANEHGIDLSYK